MNQKDKQNYIRKFYAGIIPIPLHEKAVFENALKDESKLTPIQIEAAHDGLHQIKWMEDTNEATLRIIKTIDEL